MQDTTALSRQKNMTACLWGQQPEISRAILQSEPRRDGESLTRDHSFPEGLSQPQRMRYTFQTRERCRVRRNYQITSVGGKLVEYWHKCGQRSEHHTTQRLFICLTHETRGEKFVTGHSQIRSPQMIACELNISTRRRWCQRICPWLTKV